MNIHKKTRVLILTVALFLLTACSSTKDEKITLTISAAISLTDALEEIKEVYEAEHDVELIFNLAGSGTLAQQIGQGAPVDLFISANEQWMDTLEEDGLIIPGTRSDVTGNQLALIAHTDSTLTYQSFEESIPEDLAIGNPDSVPAGAYTKEALSALGVWETIEDKLILAKDVRQVLTYIETGNATAGFVYESDARTSDHVQIVTIIGDKYHDPITYPGAIMTNTDHEDEAKALLNYLMTDDAQNIFQAHGFTK